MKKRWLILGLAAIMSCGCLFACGDNGDNSNGENDGGQMIKGEEVTKEQWDTAFANIDFNYYIWESKSVFDNGDDPEIENFIVFENTAYFQEGELDESEESGGSWCTIIDERIYMYLGNTSVWEIGDDYYDVVYYLYFVPEMLENLGILSSSIQEYTFDEKQGVYCTTVTDDEYYGFSALTVEIVIKSGEVYSIAMNGTIDEDGVTFTSQIIFEKKTIILPDEDGLNALVEANQ